METNRIEKKMVLKAARDRVWRAISDPTRFGQWFGVEIDGPFVAGQDVVGRIAPTKVDPDVARLQEPYWQDLAREGRAYRAHAIVFIPLASLRS